MVRGPWEYLDSKGTIGTGLKSDLLRTDLKNFDDVGVFLPGAADAEKRFSLYLFSRDNTTVRQLKVRKQRAGELTIGGNTYKRGA